MLVTEVLGQFRFQRGLQHIPRELVQQPARAYQAHALLLGLRKQPLRKLLLIDDLSRHRIDHHPCHLGRGFRHGRLLSDQAGPHTPLFRQSPQKALGAA